MKLIFVYGMKNMAYIFVCFHYEYIIDLAQFSGNNTLFHLCFLQIK